MARIQTARIKTASIQAIKAAIRPFRLETACHILPIHQIIEEVRQIVRPLVAEINVVGMLPHITAQKRRLTKA